MSSIQKYWDNIFPNKPSWSEKWSTRVESQSDKKLAGFHLRIIHRILPCHENLHK